MKRGPKPYPWETAPACRYGHPFPENLRHRSTRGYHCRACERATQAKVKRTRKERLKRAWQRMNSPKTYEKLENEIGSSNTKTVTMLELMKKIEHARADEKPELERQFEELQRSNG